MIPGWFALPNLKERATQLATHPVNGHTRLTGEALREMANEMELHGFTSVGEVFNYAIKAKEKEDPTGIADMRCYRLEHLSAPILALPDLTADQIRNLAQGRRIQVTIRHSKWRELYEHCSVDGSWNRL